MAYTDYPEIDIKTHRSLAKWQGRMAAVMFFGGLYAIQSMNTPTGALVVAIAALLYASANSFRAEALEWELEELKDAE